MHEHHHMLELLDGVECTSSTTCLSFSMRRELKREEFGAGLQGGERGDVWAGSWAASGRGWVRRKRPHRRL
jgi:hypothetical protein